MHFRGRGFGRFFNRNASPEATFARFHLAPISQIFKDSIDFTDSMIFYEFPEISGVGVSAAFANRTLPLKKHCSIPGGCHLKDLYRCYIFSWISMAFRGRGFELELWRLLPECCPKRNLCSLPAGCNHRFIDSSMLAADLLAGWLGCAGCLQMLGENCILG